MKKLIISVFILAMSFVSLGQNGFTKYTGTLDGSEVFRMYDKGASGEDFYLLLDSIESYISTFYPAVLNLYNTNGTTGSGRTVGITDNLNFGSDLLYLDEASGEVGMGTATPEQPLHIEKANGNVLLRSTSASGDAAMIFENSGDANDSWSFMRQAGGSFQIKYSSAQPFGASSNFFQVNSNGRIDIGDYGLGNNTGTDAYVLSTSSGGNMFEMDATDLGSFLSGEFVTENLYTANGTTGTTRTVGITDNLNFGSDLLYLDETSGNVGIANSSPHVSAILDVTSTTKGFAPPRMTAAQRDAISTPIEGLLVHNLSDSDLNFYDGTSWQPVEGKAHASLYFSTPAETTISTVDVAVKAAGTTTTNELSLFDDDSGTSNRLRYIGTTEKTFHVSSSISFSGAGSNKDFSFYIAKNGTKITGSRVKFLTSFGSNTRTVSLDWLVSLDTNDYIELFIENNTGTDNGTIAFATIVVD